MKMKKIILAITIIFSATFLFNAPISYGCTLGGGSPRYIQNVSILNNPLAGILGISFLDDSFGSNIVLFKNKGVKDTLLFYTTDKDGRYPGYSHRSENYRPYDDQLGHEFEPNVRINSDGSIQVFDGGWDSSKTTRNSGPDAIALGEFLDSTDNFKTSQKKGDGQSDTAPIPPAQKHTVYVLYNGKRYQIEVKVSYRLNPNYNSEQGKGSCDESSAQAQVQADSDTKVLFQSWIYIIIFVAISVLLAVIFTIRHSSGKKKSKTPKKKTSARKK